MTDTNKKEIKKREDAEKKPCIHKVKKNDTIRSIAEKYLGTAKRACEIRMMNNLVTDILPVGKELKIPKK